MSKYIISIVMSLFPIGLSIIMMEALDTSTPSSLMHVQSMVLGYTGILLGLITFIAMSIDKEKTNE